MTKDTLIVQEAACEDLKVVILLNAKASLRRHILNDSMYPGCKMTELWGWKTDQ